MSNEIAPLRAALCTEAARQVPMRWDTAFSLRIRQVPDGMRARLNGRALS